MPHLEATPAPHLAVHQGPRLAELPAVRRLPESLRRDIRVVAHVLPFKVNEYVLDELIDWSRVPDDPIYRLTFPHRDMLAPEDFQQVARLVDRGASPSEIRAVADDIRRRLNPHPGEQLERNVPTLEGQPIRGLQHKYRETVLCFPAPGQTCHTYCGYCFRWAQFVGLQDLRQANRDVQDLVAYLRRNPWVTDVLFTGGDPLVMSTRVLSRYVEPLLSDELAHVRSIRIGSKALAYWPHRFVTDADADDLLRLIERCVRRGRHVAFMAHVSHPRELRSSIAQKAVRRLRNAGAIIRTQAPVVRHVNDDPRVWETMWNEQVRLGLVPYYMFVERDTGALRYYELPLYRTHEIYRAARNRVSGLARTARGPSMSATPGKIVIDGVAEIRGEKVFSLRLLQGRNPDWSGRPFFARYDESAMWFDDLVPAFGASRFFFEEDQVQDWRQLTGTGRPRPEGRTTPRLHHPPFRSRLA